MFWRLGGRFVVVGGWLVQAQGTPQISINTFSYYTIIRVLRINSVLYRMERLRSPYDPSLINLQNNQVQYGIRSDCGRAVCLLIFLPKQN